MNLSKLNAGQTAIIKKLSTELGSFADRLMVMGFCPGERVKLINVTLTKNPLLFEVRDCKIAISVNNARYIEIEDIQ